MTPAFHSPTSERLSFPRSFLRPLLRCCLLSLLLLPLAASTPAQETDSQPTIRFVRNPDPAPDFKLTTLEGQLLTLAGSRGKVILLNFWATWCGPCRAEIPDLVELQKTYKDNLQVIGLVVDADEEADVKKFAAQFSINYPVAIASDDVRIQYGGIGALPTSFLVDQQGRVVQKHEGLRNPLLYEAEIRSLLNLPIGNIRVETFEDTGEIFLKHADRANQFPGVDLSKLTPEQRNAVIHRFNAETCTCGCQFTLAQCRIYDRGCATSQAATSKIVAEVAAAPATRSTPAPATPASPGNSPVPAAPRSPDTNSADPTPPTAPKRDSRLPIVPI